MAGVNKAILLGRLGQNPEFSTTQSGMEVCKFSLATSRKQKNGEEITSWHRCVAFSKSATILNQYVKKGDQLYIEGEISYGQYEKDGITRYTTDIIVNQFNFIGGGSGGNQGQQSSQGGSGGYQPPQKPVQQPATSQQQNYQPPAEDDIPF